MTEQTAPSVPPRRVIRQRAGAISDEPETRGRPADSGMSRAELATKTDDSNFQDNPELLTRRQLGDNATDFFTIPEHLKKPGWNYEFKARYVMGEPVSPTMIALERNQGWRPAPAEDFLEMLPPEYDKRTVEIGGQMLMMRPRRLDVEARNEMSDRADKQKQDKLKQALAGPADQDKRMPRVVLNDQFQTTIEGEVGTYRPRD